MRVLILLRCWILLILLSLRRHVQVQIDEQWSTTGTVDSPIYSLLDAARRSFLLVLNGDSLSEIARVLRSMLAVLNLMIEVLLRGCPSHEHGLTFTLPNLLSVLSEQGTRVVRLEFDILLNLLATNTSTDVLHSHDRLATI